MQEVVPKCERSVCWMLITQTQLEVQARLRTKPTRRNANIRALIRRLQCYLGSILRYDRNRTMQQGINPCLRCHITSPQLSARLAGDYSCFWHVLVQQRDVRPEPRSYQREESLSGTISMSLGADIHARRTSPQKPFLGEAKEASL
jgi:hypothetical protein